MSEALASAVVDVTGAYLLCGLLFAGPFVAMGVNRIDAAARHAPPGFRLIILPGVVLCWPLLAVRWARGSVHPPREVNAHRRLAARRPA